MLFPQSDLRAVNRTDCVLGRFSPAPLDGTRPHLVVPMRSLPPMALYVGALPLDSKMKKSKEKKCSICTADELHYVSIPNSDWRLALWRYLPSTLGPSRNHPLLLLSGVGTNAIGYDLSPESSFARHMSGQGFDTWILELRGAGLSTDSAAEHGQTLNPPSTKRSFKDIVMDVTERVSGFLNEGKNSDITSQIRDLSERLTDVIEEIQQSTPMQFPDFPDRISITMEDIKKRLDLIVKYDWDFDHYLEEDMPAAMEYIRTQSRPKDGRLLAIGHSMGGILLYAMLSRCGFNGTDPQLASVATLGSSLDYSSSKSSLKLLLPMRNPAEALKVPVIPLGTLAAAAHTLASSPPYLLSWLSSQISSENMMNPKLLEKLVLNNFGTVPAKLLFQLSTAFGQGGLCDRSGRFYYKNYLLRSKVPVLALAGDQDLICPPEAVYETVKLIPHHLVTYKVFGEPGSQHYGHYDLVGGLLAGDEVYPLIIEFLNHHDLV